jgi:hypothetical protein
MKAKDAIKLSKYIHANHEALAKIADGIMELPSDDINDKVQEFANEVAEQLQISLQPGELRAALNEYDIVIKTTRRSKAKEAEAIIKKLQGQVEQLAQENERLSQELQLAKTHAENLEAQKI